MMPDAALPADETKPAAPAHPPALAKRSPRTKPRHSHKARVQPRKTNRAKPFLQGVEKSKG